MSADDGWQDVDLRPAPTGWRVEFETLDGPDIKVPLVGWLVQEASWEGPGGRRARRAVAAVMSDLEVVPVEQECRRRQCPAEVFGPGQGQPPDELD